MTKASDKTFKDNCRFAKVVTTAHGFGLLIAGHVIGLDCDEETAVRLASALRNPDDVSSGLTASSKLDEAAAIGAGWAGNQYGDPCNT